jgi:hypothetical protein
LGLTDPKDFDLIRMGDTSNLMVPNNGMTGGSSTSEVTCKVVMNACAVLVERLKPYRDPISAGGKYSKRRRSNVAVIIVRIIFNSF